MGGVRGNLGRVRQEMGGVCCQVGVVHSILVLQHPRRLLPSKLLPCLTAIGPEAVAIARQLPLPAADPPSADTEHRGQSSESAS